MPAGITQAWARCEVALGAQFEPTAGAVVVAGQLGCQGKWAAKTGWAPIGHAGTDATIRHRF